MSLLGSCEQSVYKEKESILPPEEKPFDGEFNYSTTGACALSVNYNIKGVEVLNEKVEPYFAGFTQEDGTYTGNFKLPTSVKEVYIYTNMLGLPQCVKQEVVNNSITLDLLNPQLRSAAVGTKAMGTKAANEYPKDMLILGEWTSGPDGGLPEYLLDEKANISPEILTRVNKMLNEGRGRVQESHPELFDGATVSLPLTKKAEVKMAFIAEYASFKNTIGYYHYPTGSKPTDMSTVKKIIAFPNFSDKTVNKDGNASGSLELYDQVQLKYWNGSEFEDEFPANTTIEYFLLSHGYRSEGPIGNGIRQHYSDPSLNTHMKEDHMKQRCITLFEYSSGLVFVCFEDQVGGTTENFRDAVFALQTSPSDAIGGGGVQIPDGDNGPVTQTYVRKGTLAFEDLWPNEGDYDMNDVIVDYHSTVHVTPKGITRIEDQVKVNWAGGSIKSGYGYQLDGVPTYLVKSTTVNPERSSVAKTKGLENGQKNATIILFDNVHEVLGNTFTVQLDFVNPINGIEPPYNPFIIPGLGGGDRGKEVHLPGYPTTSLANPKWFEAGSNKYVSVNSYPFGIHLPDVYDIPFEIPKESVRIDESYPQYLDWVNSNGDSNKDWYLYPKLDEVNTRPSN